MGYNLDKHAKLYDTTTETGNYSPCFSLIKHAHIVLF